MREEHSADHLAQRYVCLAEAILKSCVAAAIRKGHRQLGCPKVFRLMGCLG